MVDLYYYSFFPLRSQVRLGETLGKGCEMLPPYPPRIPRIPRPCGPWAAPGPAARGPRRVPWGGHASAAAGLAGGQMAEPGGSAPRPPAEPRSALAAGAGCPAGRWVRTGLTRPLTATHPLAFVLFSQHTFGDIAEREESPGCRFASALETSG